MEEEPASGRPVTSPWGWEEALDLLAALEDAWDILVTNDNLSVLAQVEDQIQRLSHKLGFDQGRSDASELLNASEAARRLDRRGADKGAATDPAAEPALCDGRRDRSRTGGRT